MTTTTIGQPALDVPNPGPDDLQLWSVTTIIDALDKPALLYWSAEQAAIAALDNQATWQAMLTDQGRPETVKWLRDACWRRPKTLLSNADLGTTVHDVCQEYALTGQKPDGAYITARITGIGGTHIDLDHETNTVQAMLNRFDTWADRFQPSYQAAEMTVYNTTYGYAGTLDALLTIDTTRFIGDYKTSREPYDGRGKPKTPYPEQNALQLAAYRYAESAAVWRPRRYEQRRRRYYLLSGAERAQAVPLPEVDHGLIIHITPEACEAFPIDCGPEVHTAFLYTEECFRWLQETSKSVMGEPLQ
jgi:PD-(D/E)XK nuclease superfamily